MGWRVLSPVARGQGDHRPGEVIDLPGAEVGPLLEAGVIEPAGDRQNGTASAPPGEKGAPAIPDPSSGRARRSSGRKG